MFKLFKKRDKKKTIGLFIVHGFLGNPKTSFGDLSERLKKNKISYQMPNLQGHGYCEDINTFSYKECLEDIEDQYRDFVSKFDIVYLMGFSMGGVIATHLSNVIGADKLVLIAPAFKYGGTNKLTTKVTDFFKSKKVKNEDEAADLIDNIKEEDATKFLSEFMQVESSQDNIDLAKDYSEKLKRIKLSVFTNFMRLVSSVKKQIKSKIDIPTRIYISEHDDIVPIESALYGFNLIDSLDKKLTILTGIGHRILKSEIKDEIITEILLFLYGKVKK
jgi:carboxylesterase